MNGKTTKVALAIAIGSLAGVAMAMKLGGWLAWLLGPTSGGLIAYFAYEFKTAIAAIPKAWVRATSWQLNRTAIRHGLKVILLFGLAWIMVAINVLIFIHMVAFILGAWRPDVSAQSIAVICSSFGFISIAMICTMMLITSEEIEEGVSSKTYFRTFNPIAVYIYWPIRGIVWMTPRVPKVAVILGRFLSHLFRLIHSERRLIAGTWTFLGVLSWLLSVPFWICFAGSILGGVVSVEAIGKRLLKTLPAYNGA